MIYTITPDLLENIADNEKHYFTDILFLFTNRSCSLKVARDKNNEIISIYRNIKNNAETIKLWLDLMSFIPSRFEKINITIDDIDCLESKFMKLCKETKGVNKLIVYSIQNLYKFECREKKVIFEDIIINVLDRDDAKEELNGKNIFNINGVGHMIAGNDISESKNTTKFNKNE